VSHSALNTTPGVAGSPALGRRRPADFLILTGAISATVFVGFWFTYFGPMLAHAYPPSSPMLHLHGWSFFAWYLLLPVQAGLAYGRQLALHRTLGGLSLGLAVLMVATGLLVVGVRMREALDSPTPTFWTGTAPAIFVTLALFAVFYALALRDRRRPARHKRWIVVASAAGMGAAVFRILMVAAGPVDWVFPVSILLTNLFIAAGMAFDARRERRVHREYAIGLVTCLLLESGVYLATPTVAGRPLVLALGWIGSTFGGLY